MRSTICTSLACLGPADGAAQAEGPKSCFARSYGAAHLAGHPDQVVAKMTLSFDYDPSTDTDGAATGRPGAAIDVVFARQGHVMRDLGDGGEFPNGMGGEETSQVLACVPQAGLMRCTTPCGEGGFDVIRYGGKAVTIRTMGLPVGHGQDCRGFTDIAEHPGRPVSYRLDRVPTAIGDGD